MRAIHHPLFLVASVLIGATTARAAEAPPGPGVEVRAAHRGGEIVYHYEVRNRGAGSIDYFALGCDCRRPGDLVVGAQLSVLPAGATIGGEDYRGDLLDVPGESLSAPPGWHAAVRSPRGESRYWIEWHAYDAQAAIRPGQSLGGFAIALPAADSGFLTGGYLVAEAVGAMAQAGQVKPLDGSPPRLSVQLYLQGTAEAPGTLSLGTALDVSDDIDPEPRVHLESFRREGPGEGPGTARLVVTYRATDASGNTTRETARIALPGALVGLPVAGILP